MRIITSLKSELQLSWNEKSLKHRVDSGRIIHIGWSNGQVNAIQKPQSQLYTDHTQKGSSGESRTYIPYALWRLGLTWMYFTKREWCAREPCALSFATISTSSPHFSYENFFYHVTKTKIFASKRNIREYAEFGSN